MFKIGKLHGMFPASWPLELIGGACEHSWHTLSSQRWLACLSTHCQVCHIISGRWPLDCMALHQVKLQESGVGSTRRLSGAVLNRCQTKSLH
eukprot:5700700-Amphidinium_carterae.2